MTVEEMHYAFRQGISKLDSSRHRVFTIPEIDFVLNEAQERYIKLIAFPRQYKITGFEITQRDIDSIRTVVIEDFIIHRDRRKSARNYDYFNLPQDYWFFINAIPIIKHQDCGEFEGILHIRQHEDLFEFSPFDKSDWVWREVNGIFVGNSIKIYSEWCFNIDRIKLNYIRRPKYIHNAKDYYEGKYLNLKGEMLTGKQDCELPEVAHRDIVDLAVFLASIDIQLPDIQAKQIRVSNQ